MPVASRCTTLVACQVAVAAMTLCLVMAHGAAAQRHLAQAQPTGPVPPVQLPAEVSGPAGESYQAPTAAKTSAAPAPAHGSPPLPPMPAPAPAQSPPSGDSFQAAAAAAGPPNPNPPPAPPPNMPAVVVAPASADAFAAAAGVGSPSQQPAGTSNSAAPPPAGPAGSQPPPAPPAPPSPQSDPFAINANGSAAKSTQPVNPPVVAQAELPAATSLQDSPGGGQPTDLPPDVATLYSSGAPSGQGGSASAVSANKRQSDPAQGAAPGPTIGTLTSLLSPPPGAPLPSLSDEQKANVPRLQKLHQGLATVAYMRAVSNYDGTQMNCGLGYLNDHFKDFFVGIPQSMYRNSELCGLCVRLWCVDSVCRNALVANGTFIISDSCKDCQGSGLVVSARGMANVSDVDYNTNPSLQVAWEFTSCAPLIEGGIKVLPSDNNSPVFVGLNFSNQKALIKSVKINGMDMTRTPYGFWTIDTPGKNIPLRPPYSLELVGANNQKLVKRLAALTPQDLGVNFSA